MINQIKYIFLFISGVLITFVGLIAILGYLLEVRQLYEWVNGTVGMALPTALCFVTVGINMMIVSSIFEKCMLDKNCKCR